MKIPYKLATINLQASQGYTDNYGANGLPITPNSISIIGNFRARAQFVISNRLTRYVDCQRSKHEKLTITFEKFSETSGTSFLELQNLELAQRMVYEMLDALAELHYEHQIVHGCINSSALTCDDQNRFRLANWPLGTITDYGRLLDADALLCADIRFLAPERLMNLRQRPARKSDVWSLALVMLCTIDSTVRLPDNPADFLLCKTPKEVFRLLAVRSLPKQLHDFFFNSLHPMYSQRYSVKQLLQLLNRSSPVVIRTLLNHHLAKIEHNQILCLQQWNKTDHSQEIKSSNCILTIEEVHHLWQLANGQQQQQRNKQENEFRPPILNIPKILLLSQRNEDLSPEKVIVPTPSVFNVIPKDRIAFMPSDESTISLTRLEDRLQHLDLNSLHPLLHSHSLKESNEFQANRLTNHENHYKNAKNLQHQSLSNGSDASTTELPIQIRESDFTYQCERLLLYRRLITEYPFSRPKLLKEAATDIPPLYRAATWSALLDVHRTDLMLYESLDKLSAGPTDRQISVDIPRCHQYNELLASPCGHLKLRRILKAWLAANHSHCVYWQGLDSLCAPFVMLNFADEANAFACMNAFTHKYLEGFFLQDNSVTIQRYLSIFSQLHAFHDPRLCNHLRSLGFTAELYAIPWFLTMFTHVLPLHKIVHVWDTLLLGDCTFPLAVGLAILQQLRDQLLECSFNDCILIFSDLPDIDIERCVQSAKRHFTSTPSSLAHRPSTWMDEHRQELLPRIDIQELIILVLEKHRKVLFVDGRPEEEIAALGHLRDSLPANQLQLNSLPEKLFNPDLDFVVVVHNLQLAEQLLQADVPRLCTLIGCSLPPDFYCPIQSDRN